MQAIILAAGMGKRLGEYTKNNTKCMVPVNGVPLIDRLLFQLSRLPLKRVVLVIGYEGQKLKDYIGKEYKGLKIEYVNNPIYDKTNNIYSLALAKQQLQEDDTLLIESDLIFDDGMFDLLLDNPYPNLALVAKYESWMDGTMVRIDEDCNIVNFVPKQAFKYKDTDSYYKTVNIYKFSKEFSTQKYVPFLEAYSKAVGDNEYYENVLRIITFLNSHDLKALPITDEKWYEIDDKQDLDIAEALFADEKDLLRKYYGRYGGLASKCFGVREEFLIPGNGAAELIKALMEDIEGSIGVTRPTFEEYPNRVDGERHVTFIPQNEDYRYGAKDLMDFFSIHPVDTLLLINPDNPSGNFIPKSDVLILADWAEKHGIRLIVDESFVDFSDGYEYNSLLDDKILEAYPHLIVMKSISKSYGVPGLRLGILASSDRDLISKMKKQVSIWNLNSFAEFFMQIFSKHEKAYKHACSKFLEERRSFEKGLRSIPFLRVMPTQANYFLCEVLAPYTANEVVIYLLKNYNILTRDCSS